MSHTIAVMPGDGIGPEVVAATQRVVEATGIDIAWREVAGGTSAMAECGAALPDETLATIRESAATLKGPTATPSGKGFRSVNVELRQRLDLYANYRPARSLTGVDSLYDDVDVIVVRENTEGLYSGLEHTVVPGVVESLRVITEKASGRIARFAFETARRQQRGRVTCVHKANILKQSDGLFLECCRRVAAEFDDIQFDDVIVDAAAMRLVRAPQSFDIIVTSNLFGDILSDLAAGLVGGLGIVPSANVGLETSVFEAVHGSAPDIAGEGIANPTALIQSAVLMLRFLAEREAAERVQRSLLATLAAGGVLTRDLGGTASTNEFADAIIARIEQGPTSGG